MSGDGPSISWHTASFVGEILREGMPSRRPNKVEVEVRLVQGGYRRGPARLITTAGDQRAVSILGASLYARRPPIDTGIEFIVVEGIASNDIEPGQLLIQGDDMPMNGNGEIDTVSP